MDLTHFEADKMQRWILETVGLGIALTSMGWVLGHLIAFAVLGEVLVGEGNRMVVLAEIAMVSTGICCLAVTYVEHLRRG